MGKFLIFGWIALLISSMASMAQQPFLGIQNSNRKGMLNAQMNPAELNNLSRPIEVNFASVHGSISNNVLTFSEFTGGGDFLERAFDIKKPINLRSELSVLGPSVGIKINKWSLGFSTQAFVKADMVDIDPRLGESLLEEPMNRFYNEVIISSPYNQRASATGWAELGLMAGREIWKTEHYHLSAGANLKLLFPSTYFNIGLDNLNGKLIQDFSEVSLTEANGELNLSYADLYINEPGFGFNFNNFAVVGLNGIALDLGLNYQWEDGNGKKINSGLALKNLGSMTLGAGQVNNTYRMHIPEGEAFRLDLLEGNLEEIERQLLDSEFFTISRQRGGTRVNVPTLLSAYAELSLVHNLQVSLFGQKRIPDEHDNDQITAQDLLVITPRLLLGKFEIYSPWAHYQVSGLIGGLGVQFGGFFLGSQSILTGLLADSRHADFHLGFSWGFGR